MSATWTLLIFAVILSYISPRIWRISPDAAASVSFFCGFVWVLGALSVFG